MPRLIVVGSASPTVRTRRAHRRGVRDVVLVTKPALEDGATRYAQGGIAAAVRRGLLGAARGRHDERRRRAL